MSHRSVSRRALAKALRSCCFNSLGQAHSATLGLSALCLAVGASNALAQDCAPCGPSVPAIRYRLQSETIYDQVPVTRNKIEYQDVMVEREIVSYRPVTETRVERKAVTVRRPDRNLDRQSNVLGPQARHQGRVHR